MRDRLTRLGYTAATLAAIDGIAGLRAHVPSDRIIATPTRHIIWFTDPDDPSWPLPIPRETSVSEEQDEMLQAFDRRVEAALRGERAMCSS